MLLLDAVMAKASRISLLQITDIHFRERVDGTIYGIETQILFEKTLAQIKSELEGSKSPIDLLLATGDISQDGSSESYRRFNSFIRPLGIPSYFLQGNHDYVQPMLDEFGTERVAPCVVSSTDLGDSPWNIILLNSSVEDQVEGHFGPDQLDYLEQQLSLAPEAPTLICFHHHPFSINCAWLDQQVIDDAEPFFEIVKAHTNVKLAIFGHVHQDRKTIVDGVPYFATPSTCAQFKPEMDDFAIDDRAPAYRWLHLNHDGSFETEVVRLAT